MTLFDKGEYANYWGPQPEDSIFGDSNASLGNVMTLNRFKMLRRSLSFRADPSTTLSNDSAARIRPLLNLTGSRYIEVGRNVALDEASVACRSKQGRHLIVYNPMKPTGKYHFRLYLVCCSTSWVALNYRLHCNNSDIMDRLDGFAGQEEAQALREELETVSRVRQHVLEAVRLLYGSNRVVNMDNYYTSVQLLQELRLKGLYARDTVRGNSRHFPKHTVLDKEECARGDHRQGVSAQSQILAASWCDGNIVTMVSSADASTTTTVERLVGNESRTFSAPTCLKQYNQNMQGVDRLDQFRGRFSLADGHSYKRWHKKLALVLLDVARCNAFLTRRMVLSSDRGRDAHRTFMVELVSEFLSGKWVSAPSDGRMTFGDGGNSSTTDASTNVSPSSTIYTPTGQDHSPATKRCCAVSSKQIFAENGRKRRQCVVCRWEGRYPTEVTDFCPSHNVCLCRVVRPQTPTDFTCPDVTWTCWEKFHRFYLPQKLFTNKGNVRLSSQLAKLRLAHQTTSNNAAEVAPTNVARAMGLQV